MNKIIELKNIYKLLWLVCIQSNLNLFQAVHCITLCIPFQVDSSHNVHVIFLTGNPYPYQPPQYVSPRYIRNPPPPGESAVPPYPEPYPGYGPERQYQSHHSGPSFSAHPYAPPSHYSRRHGHYPAPPPQFGPPRDDLVRMSPVPLDVPPASMPPPPAGAAGSLYHPQESSSRDRYPQDGYYSTGPHPSQMRSHMRVSSVSLKRIVHSKKLDLVVTLMLFQTSIT